MLKSELKNKIQGRADDTIDEDFLDDAVDSIYYRVLSDKNVFWKFLEGTTTFNTVAGESEYDKPTVAADLDIVYDLYTDESVITSVGQRDFDTALPSPSATGLPTKYMEWGDKIKLYPTPDDAYSVTLRYYKKLTTPMSDTDEPIIPEEFQEILIIGGLMLFYEMDEDPTRFDRKVVEFDRYLKKMRESQEAEPDRTYSLERTRVTSPFGYKDYQSGRR